MEIDESSNDSSSGHSRKDTALTSHQGLSKIKKKRRVNYKEDINQILKQQQNRSKGCLNFDRVLSVHPSRQVIVAMVTTISYLHPSRSHHLSSIKKLIHHHLSSVLLHYRISAIIVIMSYRRLLHRRRRRHMVVDDDVSRVRRRRRRYRIHRHHFLLISNNNSHQYHPVI